MPAGKIHSKTSSWLGLLTLIGVIFYPLQSILVSLGCFLGIVLSPDLDVDKSYIGHYFIKIFFGEKAEWFWRLYWRRYSVAVPHRHWISHSLLISTFIRFIYAFWWVFVIFWYFGWDKYQLLQNYRTFMWVFVGLSLSDGIHVMMDKYSTWSKKR